MKIAIIGAGNVGAMVASRIIDGNLADVVLMDIVPGMAKGKALDISDARPIFGSKSKITGYENFERLKGSDIVVITAGLARKPGMSREDLLRKNAQIVKDLSGDIKNYTNPAIIIVVTNPLDVMSYLAMRVTGFNPKKVIGMAGVLDSARFINIVSEKISSLESDNIFMMGSHGDTMVPINRSKKISKDIFKECSRATRQRGAEIVEHLKTGSAYFAPSAAIFSMLKCIVNDEAKTICASAYLEGQYGEEDVYIGVPITLDRSGVKKIVEIELTEEEKKYFRQSAQKIREAIKTLKL